MRRRLAVFMAFVIRSAVIFATEPFVAALSRIDDKGRRAACGAGFLFFLVALAACATEAPRSLSTPEPVAEFPYRIDYEGWLTVQASVNGRGPYDFIVDSGATITSAFENLAQQQNFALAGRPPIRILGLTAAEQLPAYSLGGIEIGGQRLQKHVGVILPDWSPPRRSPQGVLGLDFLTHYIVHIAADEKMIRLYDPAEDFGAIPTGWSRAPMRADDFGQDSGVLYRVTVNMHGRLIPCIIDLGASGTLLNYPALRRLLSGIFVNKPKSTGFSTGTRLNDVFDNTKNARLIRVGRVSIAGAKWGRQQFVVFDAPIFVELGVAYKPFCLVGSDLMLDRSFIFDFKRQLLYIGPKAKL